MLNNDYERKVGNNLISQSQSPIMSNADTIHADNNINKSLLSNIYNHQNILSTQNPETSSVHNT